MIRIKNFDPNLLKIDKKTYKNINIYYTGYITMKNSEYVNIHRKIESIEEKNGNKYLTFASTDKNKEVLKKYTKLWDKIKSLIECNSVEKIDNKPGEYEKDYTKINFNSDNNLPLNKMLKLHNLTIIVRSVFEKDGKYYPQLS